MSSNKIMVTKASGEQDFFNKKKLKNSMLRSGADNKIINSIIGEIESQLYNGISTKIIYKMAFDLLRKKSGGVAARYKLKNAIMEFGPSGYPFEKYIGEIFKSKGFEVKTGVMVKGNCVDHEVDVLAGKDDLLLMAECKYRNNRALKTDVKVPLYIKARFDDLHHKWMNSEKGKKRFEGWVFTNTRFTTDAIQYGNCIGLKLVSWDYPKKGSLRELIDTEGLHPVTCLSSLSAFEKQQLLDINIVLSKQLLENQQLLTEIRMPKSRIKNVLKELNELCSVKQ